MKPIIYIGAERVGKAVLKTLLEEGKNIKAVFTADGVLKDQIADFVDFSDLEKKYPHVHFHYIQDYKELSAQLIQSYKPEVMLVISWSGIIRDDILNIPPKGVVGLHYSLLPDRRGGAPLSWAIIDGLKESGISLFYVNKEIDGGDVIAQEKFTIGDCETINDLLIKIEKMAPPLILKYIDSITEGTALRTKQDETKATYTKRRTPKESEIDLSWDLEKIARYIRALAPPYPSAFFRINDKRVVLTGVTPVSHKEIKIEGYIADEPIEAPKLTIVICCYNGEAYLDQCLGSLKAQQTPSDHYKVLFVNDASMDQSLAKAKQYAGHFKYFKVVNNAINKGLVASCNLALEHIDTPYFIRLDADDYFSPDAVEKIYNEVESKSQDDFIIFRRWDVINNQPQTADILDDIYTWIAVSTVFRITALRSIHGYSDEYWEEYDLYLKLLEAGMKHRISPHQIYYYTRGHSSMTQDQEKNKKGFEHLVEKWGWETLNKYGNLQRVLDYYKIGAFHVKG